MPDHSAIAIANEFLRRRTDTAWPSQMFAQKLAYIAHGWNLAINGTPLITELPEAWDNGPVYRSIWDHVKSFGYRGPNYTLAHPSTNAEIREPLTRSEAAIIDHVWTKYGHLRAGQLSKLTHEPGTPWFKAYFERARNAELDNSDIKEHYIALAMAGRASH